MRSELWQDPFGYREDTAMGKVLDQDRALASTPVVSGYTLLFKAYQPAARETAAAAELAQGASRRPAGARAWLAEAPPDLVTTAGQVPAKDAVSTRPSLLSHHASSAACSAAPCAVLRSFAAARIGRLLAGGAAWACSI